MSLQDDWFNPYPSAGTRLRTVLRGPLAVLFGILAGLRRRLFNARVLKSTALPVPVIVIGNLVVGGAGKTPLTLWLAEALRAQGWRPGVVSRGYGGAGHVQTVGPETAVQAVGDEPLLMARRLAAPVVVGRRRVDAAKALLAAHPEVNVLLCDDGLQHLALQRDLEIVVVDRRGLGNGRLLPAGPLREPATRLAATDALVAHDLDPASLPAPADLPQTFHMRLCPGDFVNLESGQRLPAGALADKPLFALAGIGEPQRFFDTLADLGLRFQSRAFPDHHRYDPADLAFAAAGTLLMTEKDAVKCRGLTAGEAFYLPVTAEVTPDLAAWVTEKLNGRKVA